MPAFNPIEQERLKAQNREKQRRYRARHPEYRAKQTEAMRRHRLKKKMNGKESEVSD